MTLYMSMARRQSGMEWDQHVPKCPASPVITARTPSSSLLKRRLKGEGGCSSQNGSLADGYLDADRAAAALRRGEVLDLQHGVDVVALAVRHVAAHLRAGRRSGQTLEHYMHCLRCLTLNLSKFESTPESLSKRERQRRQYSTCMHMERATSAVVLCADRNSRQDGQPPIIW